MARPDRSEERRAEFLPVLAGMFARTGFQRASTAALAAACGTQEPALYRLWPNKRAMFLAALDHVIVGAFAVWEPLLAATAADPDGATAAERILAYEAEHHGEHGLYRLLFGAITESDPQLRKAVRDAYRRMQAYLVTRLVEHGCGPGRANDLAWGLVGLGHVTSIVRDLRLMTNAEREGLVTTVGRLFLEAEL